MANIQIHIVNQERFIQFAPEHISFAELTTSTFVSATVNTIEVGDAQTSHYHDRPQNGEEIIFVYQGTFELLTLEEVIGPFDTSLDGPIYLHISPGTQVSIRNTGRTKVRFLSLFAPPFVMNELNFVE